MRRSDVVTVFVDASGKLTYKKGYASAEVMESLMKQGKFWNGEAVLLKKVKESLPTVDEGGKMIIPEFWEALFISGPRRGQDLDAQHPLKLDNEL